MVFVHGSGYQAQQDACKVTTWNLENNSAHRCDLAKRRDSNPTSALLVVGAQVCYLASLALGRNLVMGFSPVRMPQRSLCL